MKRRTLMTSALVLAVFAAVPALAVADTLDDIKARGTLRAAIDLGSPPFGISAGRSTLLYFL